MKKLIAITQRVERIEAIGERRDSLSQEWFGLAEECGFLPLVLPNRISHVRELIENYPVSGYILTGGNDLIPYGGDAPERDKVEKYLIERSIQQETPLLGVCRGMQMLLDFFGVPLQKVEGHVRKEHSLSNGDIVNSFHNWGAKTCPLPLRPLAWSEDGVLEAVAHENFPWIHGVMWHPERYSIFREKDIKMMEEALLL